MIPLVKKVFDLYMSVKKKLQKKTMPVNISLNIANINYNGSPNGIILGFVCAFVLLSIRFPHGISPQNLGDPLIQERQMQDGELPAKPSHVAEKKEGFSYNEVDGGSAGETQGLDCDEPYNKIETYVSDEESC